MDELIAVVTGGTRGIGLAIAESLVKRNASLAITYRGDEDAALKARRHLESFLQKEQRMLITRHKPNRLNLELMRRSAGTARSIMSGRILHPELARGCPCQRSRG